MARISIETKGHALVITILHGAGGGYVRFRHLAPPDNWTAGFISFAAKLDCSHESAFELTMSGFRTRMSCQTAYPVIGSSLPRKIVSDHVIITW